MQKFKSEKPEKRVICPFCKVNLESLENIGTFQCPECKKKFKAKSRYFTESSLKSGTEFTFPSKKKILT
jgi:tRNA(Ile2) C34 agmatinyltransferase TiaS